jgi:DNA ligase (NAD+)
MKIEIPERCPVCEGAIERINDQLFCTNKNCSAKTLKNMLHFVKTMKIMGLGEKTLEKVNIDSVSELYNLSLEELKKTLGEKIGTKIFNEIEKSKNTTLQKFISALGIPLIGKTAGEKLQNTVTSLEDITEVTCRKAGLGAKATDNMMDWMENEYYKYSELPLNFEYSEPVESGLAVCISGKVPGYTKAKIKEVLLDYNVLVKDNVTKDLDYLISEETGTTKVKKAEQYNINVISFDNFMEIINK